MGMWDWLEEQYPASNIVPYHTDPVRPPREGDFRPSPWAPNPAFMPAVTGLFPPSQIPNPSGSSRLFAPAVSDSEQEGIDPSREAELARIKAARTTANTVRPFAGRREGELTQFQEDLVVPKTPLDFALLFAGGPFGHGLKLGALTVGALLNSASDAQAGPLTRFIGANWEKQIAKARRAGFDPDLYSAHGTDHASITAFDPAKLGSGTGAPPARMGFWVAPIVDNDAAIANFFAQLTAKRTGGRPAMVPVWPRADKLGEMNLEGQGPREIAANIAEAWDKGYDALHMLNHTIARGLAGQTLIVKTAPQLRWPWAKFDLSKRHLPDLGASLAGLGYFGANYPGEDSFQ